MKELKKLTFLVMLVASIGFATGCGTGEDTEPTPGAPAAPDVSARQGWNPSQPSTFNGDNSIPHELVRNTINGEYAEIGKEYLKQNPFQPSFPSFYSWFTRVEFLREDGSKVDPQSFSIPLGHNTNVRITLESIAEPGRQYVAVGRVNITRRGFGSIRGGESLNGRDSTNQPFLLLLQNDSGGPVNLQLWGSQVTGFGGMIGTGMIMLESPSGRHVIEY